MTTFQYYMRKCSFMPTTLIVWIALILLTGNLSWAMEPPRPGEIKALKATGELESRLEFAERIGNHKIDDYLLQKAITKLKRRILASQGKTEKELEQLAPDQRQLFFPSNDN